MKILKFQLLFLLFSLICLGQNQIIEISSNLELRQIRENLYIHVSYENLDPYGLVPANGLIIINNNNAIIVDTPWNDDEAEELINWLAKIMKLGIQAVIVTHWHQDCMGGLRVVHDHGIPSYALELTRRIAEEKKLPLPEITFTDKLILYQNKTEIICHYLGAGHTIDNIVIWLPDYNTLFGGCMVKSAGSKNLGFTGDADLFAWPVTLQNVLKEYSRCEIVIPGHGAPGGTELIQHTISLLNSNR